MTSSELGNLKFPFHDLSKLVWTPTEWLIKGLLPDDSLAMVYGGQDTGKTYFVFDQALSIGTGQDFHGHEVKRKGPVFYIAGEFARGYIARREAWQRGVGCLASQVYLSARSCDLADSESVEAVRESLHHYRRQYGSPALVVIDTLNRNYTGSENETAEMTKVLHSLDSIRIEFQCTVLVVHHCGTTNENRPRGSQVIFNSTDVAYLVERSRDSAVFKVSAVRMKDSRAPGLLTFRMNYVCVGKDEDGLPEESSYLSIEEADTSSRSKSYSNTTASILRWFHGNPDLETGPKSLSTLLKIGSDNAGKSLKELMRDGHIKQTSRGVYKLVPNSPDDSEKSGKSET